jgi:hypothetical protein
MDIPRTNLLEFLGTEQTNLLVTMVKCHPDIAGPLPILDGAYQTPLRFIDVNMKDEHKQTVLALYLFTHYHLYFSTTCLLRCHLSDSLGSTRKAIDASLTAYRLIEEPQTLGQYYEGHRHFQNIKGFVARIRKHDATKYPLAAQLIALHELCSEFGSHADISSFIHRIAVEKEKGQPKGLFKVLMFQLPNTDVELRGYVVQTLLAYTLMAKIYGGFFKAVAAGLDVAGWNAQIEKLEKAFVSEAGKLEAQLHAAEN